MENLYSLSFFLLFLGFAQDILAQDFKDCNTASSPCGDSPFHFDYFFGVGTMEPDIDLTCLGSEINSTWISWSVIQGGTLTFVITPDDEDEDIDFLVFKLGSQNTCEDKELIRCMASGENASAPRDEWEICLGPTGLSIGESDTEEFAGCSDGDNNFLAPLETNEGDSYVLFVNHFRNNGKGFTISFEGDAILDCITVPTMEKEPPSIASFELFPSISFGDLILKLSSERYLGAQLVICNMWGQWVYSESSIKELSHRIDLTNLPNGAYFATIQKKRMVCTEKFFVVK